MDSHLLYTYINTCVVLLQHAPIISAFKLIPDYVMLIEKNNIQTTDRTLSHGLMQLDFVELQSCDSHQHGIDSCIDRRNRILRYDVYIMYICLYTFKKIFQS